MVSFRTAKVAAAAPLMVLTLEPVSENPHLGGVRCWAGNEYAEIDRGRLEGEHKEVCFSRPHESADHDRRGGVAEDVALGASNDVNENNNTKNTDISAAFVAPEYLFTANDRHFMGEQAKEAVQVHLAALLMPWEINVF
jgi:hypothetical protein